MLGVWIVTCLFSIVLECLLGCSKGSCSNRVSIKGTHVESSGHFEDKALHMLIEACEFGGLKVERGLIGASIVLFYHCVKGQPLVTITGLLLPLPCNLHALMVMGI